MSKGIYVRPQYGSAILVELYGPEDANIDLSNYHIKVLLRNNTKVDPFELQVEGRVDIAIIFADYLNHFFIVLSLKRYIYI